MAENTNILEINGLHKNFFIRGQKFEVLAGVDLTVKKGELLAIVGASGCGKSMIFQEARLFPWLTVEQNIEFVISDTVPRAEKKKMVDYYIKLVGLTEFTNAVPNQLSGGMQQRVSIARALATRPQLLLLDEPFGALDAFTRMAMQQEVLRIWEQDKTTMMIVTHDIDEAIYLSNRVVIMGKNPGVVKKIVPVNLPFPRDRTDSAFLEIRGEIMKEFLDT